jgi:hypothetical protein
MLIVSLIPTEPIREPVSKFGGQPNWLTNAQWPLGRSDGKPMRFICQVRLPEHLRCGGQEMAYLFMSDNVRAPTWEVEAGDNAVILQPAPFTPHVQVAQIEHGPTLQMMRPGPTGNRLIPVEVEYAAELMDLPDDAAEDKDYRLTTRIGGPPKWLQNDEWPKGGSWRFLMQVDSCSDLYSVNFGDAGVGYAFLSEDGTQARFLWQCC